MPVKLKEGLTYNHFAHPFDIAGMNRLRESFSSVEKINNQIEDIQKEVEDEFYLLNIADNIKLNQNQGAEIYNMVSEVSDILSVSTPNVFLNSDPYLNAYALGGSNPSVVLNSALIQSFSGEMLRAVIGHELGHIICKHTFFRIMAECYDHFSQIVSIIPFFGSLLSLSTRWYLFDWYRKSELSADRASLLATQDIESIKQTILHIAGGSSVLANQLNSSAYMEQANEFKELMIAKRGESIQERTSFLFSGFMMQHATSSHPWPAVRLVEIDKWANSEQYELLIQGNYEKAEELSNSVLNESDILLPPPGEDIKEYVKDLSKSVGEGLKGLFKNTQSNDS